jgi:hypothetical protein
VDVKWRESDVRVTCVGKAARGDGEAVRGGERLPHGILGPSFAVTVRARYEYERTPNRRRTGRHPDESGSAKSGVHHLILPLWYGE